MGWWGEASTPVLTLILLWFRLRLRRDLASQGALLNGDAMLLHGRHLSLGLLLGQLLIVMNLFAPCAALGRLCALL